MECGPHIITREGNMPIPCYIMKFFGALCTNIVEVGISVGGDKPSFELNAYSYEVDASNVEGSVTISLEPPACLIIAAYVKVSATRRELC